MHEDDRTHFLLINEFCKEKYKTTEEMDVSMLLAAQKRAFYNNLKLKTLHS